MSQLVLLKACAKNKFSALTMKEMQAISAARYRIKIMGSHLEEDLDEDSAAGCGVVLGDANRVQHCPADGVGCQEVGKEFGNVAELVSLQPMHKGVLLSEALLVEGLPALVMPTVPLCQQPVVPAQLQNFSDISEDGLLQSAVDNAAKLQSYSLRLCNSFLLFCAQSPRQTIYHQDFPPHQPVCKEQAETRRGLYTRKREM